MCPEISVSGSNAQAQVLIYQEVKMRRAAVFAHYDKDKIIDDYVVYYLKALKEIFEVIVFVSCQELSEYEKAKLDGIVDYVIAENHNEYDFGSYKRGYYYLLSKGLEGNFEELGFINDSCYGPLYTLKPIIEQVGECDFWGMTANREYGGHIQSFFMVFKKQVFSSKVFKDFIADIKEQDDKFNIVFKYEIGLSKLLKKNGFKLDYAIKFDKKYRSNITILKWREAVLKYNMPLLKCSLLRGKNTADTTIADWESVIPEGYPIELIKKNLERTKEKNINTTRLKNVRIFLFDIAANLRKTPRRIFLKFMRFCLPFMFD